MDNPAVTKLLDRFSEPSSYAGLTGILAIAGVVIPGGLVQSVIYLAAGICGVVSIILKEKGTKTQ